jgi:hypothetical protein
VNGYYTSELIYGPAHTESWKTIEDVELATLGSVHWHNTSRLHGYLNDTPTAEFDAIFYATKRTDQPLVEIHVARASMKIRAIHTQSTGCLARGVRPVDSSSKITFSEVMPPTLPSAP